jgi:8-oxo-dGTP pyrophosphatase MutT (NUDIX family)
VRARIWITAGGTREPIDRVRVIANSSTGRFGAAIARAAVQRGADVTVFASRELARRPDWLPGCRIRGYGSMRDLDAALDRALQDEGSPHVLLMAAAVADYAPEPQEGKIRSTAAHLDIHLVKNPKILASLRERCGERTRIVGFKLLVDVPHDQLVAVADAQRRDNGLDLVVANDLVDLTATHHPVTLVSAKGATRHPGRRDQVAEGIVTHLLGAATTDADRPVGGRIRHWQALPDAHHHTLLHAEDWSHLGRLLAVSAPSPWHPLQATVAGVLHVGGAAADRIDVAGTPVVCDGRCVGTIVDGHLEADPEDAEAVAVSLRGARWTTSPALARALRKHGFRADGDTIVAPWAAPLREAASVCLVDLSSRQVLLGRRPETVWAFPGGRLEPGETAWEAARRELLEETGLTVPGAPWTTTVAYAAARDVWRITCHVVGTFGTPAPRTTRELEASWVPLSEARSRDLAPGMGRVLRELPLLTRLHAPR